MKFSAALTRQILAGKKTMTRRPLKGADAAYASELLADHAPHDEPAADCPVCIGGPIPKLPSRYVAGRSYTLQRPKRRDEMSNEEIVRVDEGRGRPPVISVARFTVTAVRLEPVGAIGLKDARREGFRTTADFKEYWLRLYERWWFIEPGTVTTGRERTTEEILARFEARHARRPVWVFSFELGAPEPRFLAVRSELGYVRTTHDHEGEQIALLEDLDDGAGGTRREGVEAVDDATLARFTADARDRDSDLAADRQAEREALPFDERISRLRIAAWTKGIDVSRDIRLLQKHHANGAADAVRRRFAAVDAKVFPTAASKAA